MFRGAAVLITIYVYISRINLTYADLSKLKISHILQGPRQKFHRMDAKYGGKQSITFFKTKTF